MTKRLTEYRINQIRRELSVSVSTEQYYILYEYIREFEATQKENEDLRGNIEMLTQLLEFRREMSEIQNDALERVIRQRNEYHQELMDLKMSNRS